ncbi:SusC/RagA family TonB-linked outer membrane protein [Parapedobacter deserti]|uniref:SusC/RagA family TonB-linked outer membrane protein n=1 Tax=Parapedobacter deserti TaxID=1912957 RepID=A0ABV7JMZ7_9SPHI
MISVYKQGLLRQLHCPMGVGLLPLLIFYSLFAMAQADVQVYGTVRSDDGEVLSGVSVRTADGTASTSTDDEGRFSIRVPANSVLLFGYIGYAEQRITVGQANQQLTVTLLAATSALDEVVVVGYGTQRREAVTGSVASVSGNVLREVQSANFSQALQGRLPGVELTQTSSQPGGTMQIRIRGSRSLTASNDPLIVLDGIPFVGSINDINPNDIKSLDILKDASATAIYGSRGANGVILVTTNRGQMGQQARVSYNSFTGMKEVFGKFPMMSGPDMVKLRQLNVPYNSYGLDEAEDIDTDWQDLLYRTATMTSHDVSISSGTEQGSYNFGGGYMLDQAVIPTQQFSRYALRGSVDQGVGKYFRFGITTNNNYNFTEGTQVNVGNLLRISPLANPFNEDGSWRRTVRASIDEPWVYSREIVENLRDQWLSETRAFASFNSAYGEVSIPWVEGLKYRVNLGLDYRQSNGGAYTGQGITSTNPTTISSASVSNQHTYHWLVENLLTYDRTFAGKHDINVVALYSAEQNKMNRSRMAATDIPSDHFRFYNLGHANGEITVPPGDQWYEVWGLMSYMGRVMYSYDNRYMLTATLRSDGSSRLATGHKWHTYPALSAGWNIAQESFMQGIPQINMLKLRVGWGQTSNQAVATYSTLGALSTRPYNFGSDFAVGYFVNQLPSPHLGWEFSNTANFGLDFSLLNHRLSGTVEYYITKTKDLLLNKGLPPSSGVNSITENVGRTQNKGIELALNGTILDNRNGWTWEAGVNLYANRNLLVSLASGLDRNESNWWFVGHPIDVIYDFKRIGLWQEGDPHRNILEPDENTLGMIKVEYFGDYDENGVPTRAINGDYDRVPIDMQPNFQGGFNTRVAYKGFDLSAVGLFKSGGILNSSIYGSNGYLNLLNGRNGNIKVDYWTPDNTGAKYPNPEGPRSGDNLKYMSTMGYFNASFLKIRTLTLGYDFSQLRRSGVNLRLYVTAQNPFVLFSPYHKESGMDPEPNSFGNENAAVNLSDNLRRITTLGTNTPATRNYLIGVNLTF